MILGIKRKISFLLAVVLSFSICILPVEKAYAQTPLPAISSSKYISTYTYASSGKVYAYKEASLKNKTGGYIACATDECRIIEINGNAVKVSYPVSGGRKTAWFDREAFTYRDLASNGAQKKFTSTKKVTTYKWKKNNNEFGYIASGDVCYLLRGDSESDWLQLIYPVSGGYKMGWVKGADIRTVIWPVTTKITLNTTSVTLTGIGSTTALSATVTPSNSTQGISWSSSNTSVATVDNGTVKAVGEGSATITAVSGSTSATANVKVVVNTAPVTPSVIEPTGISLNRGDFKLTKIGQTCKLSATVSPSNATDQSVSWSSSKKDVATVNSTGTVTAKNNGTAKITAKTSNGKTTSVTVTVKLASKKYGANLKKIPFYKQKDAKWKNVAYGYKDKSKKVKATIGSSGCGLLSVTNAVYYLNGKFINPKTLATYSLKNGYRINGEGTDHAFCKSFIKNKGSKYNVKYAGTVTGYSELRKGINSGYVAVCTLPGHFMSIVDYNASTKKFLVLDSYPKSARGTSKGYAWKTVKQLKALKLRTEFYLIKNK